MASVYSVVCLVPFKTVCALPGSGVNYLQVTFARLVYQDVTKELLYNIPRPGDLTLGAFKQRSRQMQAARDVKPNKVQRRTQTSVIVSYTWPLHAFQRRRRSVRCSQGTNPHTVAETWLNM
jgi:hypothetical protein